MKKTALVVVHVRLFADDLAALRRLAETRRTKYQTELRLLVHRALKGERRELLVVKDT